MMRRLTHTLPLLLCALLAGCRHGLLVDGRYEWVQEQVPKLVSFKPTEDHRGLEVEEQTDHVLRIQGHEGLVRLANDKWLFFTMCSSHTSLPDIIVAIDSDGGLYACNGHVCPDLILTWPKDRPPGDPLSLADFADSRVSLQTGHKGAERWVRVDEWKDTNPNKAAAH